MKRFLATSPSNVLLFQRLVLGAVVLPHGLQKAFGWFHGYGYDGTMGFFASIGVPAILGFLIIASDLLGSLALIAGLGTRLAAFGAAATMAGAILLVHLPNGFFMNWGGAPHGEGYELHLLALGLAIPLMVKGGGAWSLDRLLSVDIGSALPGVFTRSRRKERGAPSLQTPAGLASARQADVRRAAAGADPIGELQRPAVGFGDLSAER